jgi:hypothetical protein
MKYILILLALITVQCKAAHFINKEEEEKYLKNLDTIIVDHMGVDRIIFNADTIFVKMVQPAQVIMRKASFEQKWVDEHPILFTLIIAALTVIAEVELFKMVLKK